MVCSYHYNAGRVSWRFGLHVLLNGDATTKAQLQKLNGWIRASTDDDPSKIKAGYSLDESGLGNYFTTFFAAPVGVSALLNAANQHWLNDVYDSVRATHEGYYEDSVNLLCLLAMTANYWAP